MHPMFELRRRIVDAFPDARVVLDVPLEPTDVWSMSVFMPDGRHVAVAWKKWNGFGIVWDPDHGYGEGAQEVFADIGPAAERVLGLLGGDDES